MTDYNFNENFIFWVDDTNRARVGCLICEDTGSEYDVYAQGSYLEDVFAAAQEHFQGHVIEAAEADVNDKAPLESDTDQLVKDLKALATDVVSTYRPQVQKLLADFGLKNLLK